jgi:hypothetical protein
MGRNQFHHFRGCSVQINNQLMRTKSEIIGIRHLIWPRPSENSLHHYDITLAQTHSSSRPMEALPSPVDQTNTHFAPAKWDYAFLSGVLQEIIMWLSEDENQLRRDLQGVASDLRWSAVELLRIAEQLRLAGNDVDAQATQKLCELFQGDEERLAGYAEEVKAKVIRRTKAH